MYCVQTDFNNDGLMDVFIARGAWLPFADPAQPAAQRWATDASPTSPRQAGLSAPVNSNSAMWADYDNDGWLDLFVCCELQHNRLYRNRGNGTFEEVSVRAGLPGPGQPLGCCKGATWIDFDNDDFPDLFVNYRLGPAELYHNNRDGTFTNATTVHEGRRSARGLLVLGLGLRQRRLARHLRHLLRPLAPRCREGIDRSAAPT